MASKVSLDYQMFWTQPRKTPRAPASSPKCRPLMSRAVGRSTHEPICILDCESTSDGIDNSVDRAGDNVQSGSVVRLPDVLLGQELVVDGMARQQVATGLSDLGETGSVEVLASPQTSTSSWFSSASFTSRSTPFTTQDDDISLDYSNDELYLINSALLGPSIDCATPCYPRIDLDDATDAFNAAASEPLLPSRDTLAVIFSGYASNSAVTASNLPRQAVRSVGCPSELLEPLPKRRIAERSSKGHKASVEESRTRCSSIESAIRAKTHTSTLVRSHPNSPIACTPLHDSHDDAGVAEFEEWPLHNVLSKRITLNSVASFQLQFD